MTERIRKALASRETLYLILAFAAIYLIWGSTYLAIKYAIETIPSFIMAAVRFLVAGTVLYLVGRLSKGYERPRPEHWKTSLIVGTLLLGVGNGGVVVAEHYLSSSLTALLIATNPFWVVLISWLFMRKGRPHGKVFVGLLVGFIGVALLIAGRGDGAGQTQWIGIGLIVFATIGWATGSLYGSQAPVAKGLFLSAGMQMLAGGVVLLLVSLVAGEWATFDPRAVSRESWYALLYLIVVGAIVAYTAYSWLIQNAAPSAVSTYAYVNPVIAVILGWLIAGESVTGQMLLGAAAIIGSVVLITATRKPAERGEDDLYPDEIIHRTAAT